jgi:hypothetical protein
VKTIYVVVIICFWLLHTSYARNRGGMCYTTECGMVEDGLTERASEDNLGGVRKLSRRYRVTQIMLGETGNFVVKVDVKEMWRKD